MYILMITLPKRRAIVALTTAVIFIATGILPLKDVFFAIDWNVLMMIFGTMVIVDYFIDSKMPNLIAEKLLDVAPNVMWVTIFMSLFSGMRLGILESMK